MIERYIEMYSHAWEVAVLFGGLILGFAVSIFLHEIGHYLASYRGKPRFGYCGKGAKMMFFVTSAFGDDFYWRLYNQDRSNAWKKQIVISGSGVIASLLVATIFLWITISSANMVIPFGVCVLSGGLSLFNFGLFFSNLLTASTSSDGFKIRRAMKYRQSFVSHLEEIGYQFTPDHLKAEVARFQMVSHREGY